MKTPLVSVITPCYNCASYIGQCIDSVCNQSFGDWEQIVVDDGSTDSSPQRIGQLAAREPRIRPLQSKVNRGVANARNMALAQARGRYIAFLDGDDWWFSEKLEKQLALMQRHNAVVSATAFEIRSSEGKLTAVRRPPARISYRQLLYLNLIGMLTGIYDSEIAGRKYFFHPFGNEDDILWLELVRDWGPALGLNEVLAGYRRYPGSRSSSISTVAIRRWQSYRHSLGLSLLSSAGCFAGYAMASVRWRLGAAFHRRFDVG